MLTHINELISPMLQITQKACSVYEPLDYMQCCSRECRCAYRVDVVRV